MAQNDQPASGGGATTALKAAAAVAATGAAAYGIRRIRAAHDEPPESTGTREELTQTLSSKVVDAKKAASKLKPGSSNSSVLGTAWNSASGHVLPAVKDAASSLGAVVARKAPDIVRDEVIPGFIEGFEREA